MNLSYANEIALTTQNLHPADIWHRFSGADVVREYCQTMRLRLGQCHDSGARIARLIDFD